MKQAIIRWILISLAVLALGPVLAKLTGLALDPWGGSDTTALLSASPALSLSMVVLAIALAGAFGMIAARLTTVGVGMFCAGAALSWSAYTGATTEGLIRISESGRPLWMLGIEAAGLGALTIGIAIFIVKSSSDQLNKSNEYERFSMQTALAVGVSFLVAAIVAWVIARSGTSGQSLAAAWIASMLAVAAGRSVAPGASIVACLAGVLLVGVVGPVAAVFLHGGGLLETVYSGGLFPLARLTPLDWAAGVLVGAPAGSVWAASVIEKNMPSGSTPVRA
jgi:hypothetical protein